jgi:hypothetical protein
MQAIDRKMGDAVVNDDNEQFHCGGPFGANNWRSLVSQARKEKASLGPCLMRWEKR